jgi:hypothetical protein
MMVRNTFNISLFRKRKINNRFNYLPGEFQIGVAFLNPQRETRALEHLKKCVKQI